MIYDRILVKYGELTLKGKNRKTFLNKVVNNIKLKLKGLDRLRFEKTRDRFYIILNGEDYNEVIKRLDKVFGLHSYSLAVKCKSEMDIILEKTFEVFKNTDYNNKSFKVETKRAWKQFPIQSMDISKKVAGNILINIDNLKVDVRNPDILLKVEVRTEGTFIMTNEIKGSGGFPVGIGGKGMLMLSGGIDSPVAGYLAMKRGLNVEAVHFASPPYTSDRSKQKVLDLAEKLAHYSDSDEFLVHVVPFTKIQKAIYEYVPKSYTMTVMRRMMYRINEEIAKKNNALVMVNGESLGQVASQTIESMFCINNVTNMPVIRPVSTMDKLEIIGIARKIDTYETSIRPFEDCCTVFVPENPVTKPLLEKCINYEKLFEWQELIDECVANYETYHVKKDEQIILDFVENCALDTENLF